MKYDLREITPREMLCVAAFCPAIYEETPRSMECFIGACPRIYSEESEGHYLIVGERIDPQEFGLVEKVSESEVLIRVPKKLIDNKGK